MIAEARFDGSSNQRSGPNLIPYQKGLKMVAMVKTVLGLLLLLIFVVAAAGCVNINKPDNEPKKEVSIGGEHGIVVEH